MTDLYNFIKNCENGKRIWVEDELGRKDYSLSYKSTYPEWSRFYFVKTPKNKDIYTTKIIQLGKMVIIMVTQQDYIKCLKML